MFDDAALETSKNITKPLLYRRKPRRYRNLLAMKQERPEDFLTELPEAGESFHIVSNGRFDYWCFVPVVLKLLGRPAESFHGSTWTMNRNNVLDLFEMFDSGRIKQMSILTGTYFKRRESSVANTLIEGMQARAMRYRAFGNHCKVMLINAPPDFICIEGSANFTANPRLEQNVMVNDRGLFEFHREWMERILS